MLPSNQLTHLSHRYSHLLGHTHTLTKIVINGLKKQAHLIDHEARLSLHTHGQPMYNIRTLGFKSFNGETMTDPKILKLLQRDYST